MQLIKNGKNECYYGVYSKKFSIDNYQSYLLICVEIVSNSSFKEDHHVAEIITSEMNRLYG